MRAVFQTKLGWPHGNCFAACFASIFEIPLEVCPTIPDDRIEDAALWWNTSYALWWNTWYVWLTERNLGMLMVQRTGNFILRPRGFSIAGGKSPRGEFDHAVVALDGIMVHDPHPSGKGLDGPVNDYTVFYVLDPTKPTRIIP